MSVKTFLQGQPQVDGLYRVAYRGAYKLMKAYWTLRRPATHGALVAVWHDGRILLVKNSYVPYYSLPGGYVARGETGRAAARRELAEEVGIVAGEEELTPALEVTHTWEGRTDRVELFNLDLPYEPQVQVDNREVVAGGFYPAEEALRFELFPPIGEVIRRRLAQR